ncbi:hypothetical protein FQA47_019332 [Oryzias melastigma]|uniref:Uncharacterized protein n=1 Tax=Oryzias melastigma TaxID=30732 RepID=A0A834CCD7_ORYME|nr:hypothetical protein FQA47_019332 [Oryzias melastigma]
MASYMEPKEPTTTPTERLNRYTGGGFFDQNRTGLNRVTIILVLQNARWRKKTS